MKNTVHLSTESLALFTQSYTMFRAMPRCARDICLQSLPGNKPIAEKAQPGIRPHEPPKFH